MSEFFSAVSASAACARAPVVVQRHGREGVLRRRRVELQQRRVQQHEQRRDDRQQEVHDDQHAGDRPPLAEVHRAGPESLARHRLVVLAGAPAKLEIATPMIGDDQQADGQRAGGRQVRRVVAQHEVDPAGEDVDAVLQAQQRGHLEALQAAHHHDQDRGDDRGPGQRQGDLAEHRPAARARHQRRLLQRRVHRAERRHHEQEDDRRQLQPLDPDHSPDAEDVDRPRARRSAPGSG